MVKPLPPTRQISPCATIAEQGVLRFSGKKIFPGFQVSGPVSMAIRKRLSPKWPIKSRLIQRVSSSTSGTRRLLGNVVLSDLSPPSPFRCGTTKTRVLSRHVFRGGTQGGQSAARGRRVPDVWGGL